MPAVVDWGRREYGDALASMRELVQRRRAGAIGDTLVLVEHPPVVTVGVEGDDGGARDSGLPVFQIERGGKATYHGPGQLVGYPIVDLSDRGRDVRRFVHDLEEIVIRTNARFGVASQHISGRRGVWVDGERKIASIGIAVDHWVTFHGFALNVDPDLAEFERIRPCGFDASVMTSIGREIRRPIALEEVKPGIVAAWNDRFDPGRPTGARSSIPAPA
jgi:lipoate-protein ligase B